MLMLSESWETFNMMLRFYLTDGNCLVSKIDNEVDMETIAKNMHESDMVIADNRIINIRNITYIEVVDKP